MKFFHWLFTAVAIPSRLESFDESPASFKSSNILLNMRTRLPPKKPLIFTFCLGLYTLNTEYPPNRSPVKTCLGLKML